MPLPWTIRTRGIPARNARSTKLSTSRVASSTFWPMTLISVGTFQIAHVFLQRNFHAAGAGRLHRRVANAGDDLGDVFAGDAHFHRADFDFEMLVVDFLLHHSGARPWT